MKTVREDLTRVMEFATVRDSKKMMKLVLTAVVRKKNIPPDDGTEITRLVHKLREILLSDQATQDGRLPGSICQLKEKRKLSKDARYLCGYIYDKYLRIKSFRALS